MAGKQAQLGHFVFSVATASYARLARTDTYRWAAGERIAGAPYYEFAGAGARTLSLDGIYYYQFHAHHTRVAARDAPATLQPMEVLRAMAARGTPYALVVGAAAPHTFLSLGDYIITTIKETGSHFANDGRPLKVEFNLELAHYTMPAKPTVA